MRIKRNLGGEEGKKRRTGKKGKVKCWEEVLREGMVMWTSEERNFNFS